MNRNEATAILDDIADQENVIADAGLEPCAIFVNKDYLINLHLALNNYRMAVILPDNNNSYYDSLKLTKYLLTIIIVKNSKVNIEVVGKGKRADSKKSLMGVIDL